MLEVGEGEIEELGDVVIVERVVDEPPGTAPAHDPRRAQEAEGVGDGGFAHADQRGEVTDAEFAGEAEGVEQAGPVGVAEQFEELGDPRSLGRIDQPDPHGVDDLVVAARRFGEGSDHCHLNNSTGIHGCGATAPVTSGSIVERG